MADNIKFNKIEEALQDIKEGKPVIVADDEDRENEGDFVMAADQVTPEAINLMIKEGRGLVCVPIKREKARTLELPYMVEDGDPDEAAFTVSIDHKFNTSTGISASDRAATIKAMLDPDAAPSDFRRPGHIFPLIASEGGTLRRAGHTEAAIDLSNLSGFSPAGVICEIMNENGEMARLPDLYEKARRLDLKLISIKDLIAYRMQYESLIQEIVKVKLPTVYGDFELHAYEEKVTGATHLALVKGTWNKDESILVRVHSACLTGDIFGSKRCDCGDQLHESLRIIEKEGKGVVVYMNQEGRGIGLINKLKAYKLQEEGYDTVEANLELGFKSDHRDYGVGAQILKDLGVCYMRLITNNPIKRVGLKGYGLEVVERIPIETTTYPENTDYLRTKRDKMGHQLTHLDPHSASFLEDIVSKK